jgi:hypothetical protein
MTKPIEIDLSNQEVRGACPASPSTALSSGCAGSSPVPGLAADALQSTGALARLVEDLAAEFGPGYSNGVVCILVHPDLPEHFGRDEWAKWSFRPAEAAFAWAHKRGLIEPSEMSLKWTFTPLGLLASEYFRAASVAARPEGGQ